MATSTEQSSSGGQLGGIWDSVKSAAAKHPGTEQLLSAATNYVGARAQKALGSVGEKAGGLTQKLTDFSEGNLSGSDLLDRGAKNVAEGDNPAKAALKATGSTIKDKVAGVFKRGKSSGKPKVINIIEEIDVGVPVRVAYDQWTQFQEFSRFMKGVQSVEANDEVETTWRAKIWWSTRSWKATTTEQIPDQRIAWTSEGDKGSTNGVVTFHPLGDNLTKVLLNVEYYPSGFFEKTGNIWRAVGRRARLDLKHFRRFVMSQNEATDSYRGEIRDGEVVKSHEDAIQEEEQSQQDEQRDELEQPDGEGPRDEYEDDEYEDEEDDGPRDEYEEDEYEDEDEEEDEAPRDEYEEEEDEPEEEEPPRRQRGRRREPART